MADTITNLKSYFFSNICYMYVVVYVTKNMNVQNRLDCSEIFVYTTKNVNVVFLSLSCVAS